MSRQTDRGTSWRTDRATMVQQLIEPPPPPPAQEPAPYMPAQPQVIIGREVRERGSLGRLMQVLFWGWQIYCVLWFGNFQIKLAASGAGETAAALANLIGVGFIGWLWFIGTLGLGTLMFFTRGPKTIVYQRD